MPTENPKISAYVPQAVYQRFKQFQEERNLSMSQAVIEILVEYFGIDLTNNSTKEFIGGLPNRVGRLEQELANLKQSYVHLFQKVDLIQSTSESPVILVVQDSEENSSELLGGTTNNLLDESASQSIPLNESISKLPKEDVESGLPSEPIDNSPLELVLEAVDTNPSLQSLLSELPSEFSIDSQITPLKAVEFAKRLNLSETMISKVKKYPIDKQISYTKEKDNDRAWVYCTSNKLFYPLKVSE